MVTKTRLPNKTRWRGKAPQWHLYTSTQPHKKQGEDPHSEKRREIKKESNELHRQQMKDKLRQRHRGPHLHKDGSSYRTPLVFRRALDTGQENNDSFKVIRSSDHRARAYSHGRQEKQISVVTTGYLQTTSTSDKSKDKRSSADDNLIQYVDEVT